MLLQVCHKCGEKDSEISALKREVDCLKAKLNTVTSKLSLFFSLSLAFLFNLSIFRQLYCSDLQCSLSMIGIYSF